MNKDVFDTDVFYNERKEYYGEKRLSSFSCFAIGASAIINILIIVYALVVTALT